MTGSPRSDDRSETRANDTTVSAAATGLAECIQGSLATGGDIELLATQFIQLLWKLARGEASDEHLLVLGVKLEELDRTIVGLRDRAARVAALAGDVAARDVTLTTVRNELASALALAVQRAACITALESEVAIAHHARSVAEHDRGERMHAALETLAAQGRGAVRVLADLNGLFDRTNRSREAFAEVVASLAPLLTPAAPSPLTATPSIDRAPLETRIRALETFEADAHEALAATIAEREDLDTDLETAQAAARVHADDPAVQQRPRIITARIAQLDVYMSAIQRSVEPIGRELHALRQRIHALDLLTAPIEAGAALPELPPYPDAMDAVQEAMIMDAPVQQEMVTVPGAAPKETTVVTPATIELALALYDIAARGSRRPAGRIARTAAHVGILDRYGLQVVHIMAALLDERHRPAIDPYLKYGGTMGGMTWCTTYLRTAVPVPAAWLARINARERADFLREYDEKRVPLKKNPRKE